MKKNVIIISLIFILPIVAFVFMSDSKAVSATKHKAGQPQVIKFSSKLCMDCKKLKTGFEEVAPKYDSKIHIQEIDVQNNDKKTAELIGQYGITLVPTVIYIDKNGKEVRRTEGYVEKEKLEQYFNELIK